MNVQSKIQIVKNRAVISAQDIAVLLGRKHLSVLRAIDAIPSEHLRDGMYLIINGEVFITATGISMLNISRKHLGMRFKIMNHLFNTNETYRAEYLHAFHTAKPPIPVLLLLLWLNKHIWTCAAVMLLKIIYRYKGFNPLTLAGYHAPDKGLR